MSEVTVGDVVKFLDRCITWPARIVSLVACPWHLAIVMYGTPDASNWIGLVVSVLVLVVWAAEQTR